MRDRQTDSEIHYKDKEGERWLGRQVNRQINREREGVCTCVCEGRAGRKRHYSAETAAGSISSD